MLLGFGAGMREYVVFVVFVAMLPLLLLLPEGFCCFCCSTILLSKFVALGQQKGMVLFFVLSLLLPGLLLQKSEALQGFKGYIQQNNIISIIDYKRNNRHTHIRLIRNIRSYTRTRARGAKK